MQRVDIVYTSLIVDRKPIEFLFLYENENTLKK